MDKKMMKLNDDDLENVSGGNISETIALSNKLKTNNLDTIKNILESTYNISAELSTSDTVNNEYKDIGTQRPMSHEEVMNKVANVSKRFHLT